MGYTGLVQMGYGARTFSTHRNNGAGTFFIKHIYGANTFLFIFMNYFLHQILFVLITESNLWQAAKIN